MKSSNTKKWQNKLLYHSINKRKESFAKTFPTRKSDDYRDKDEIICLETNVEIDASQ